MSSPCKETVSSCSGKIEQKGGKRKLDNTNSPSTDLSSKNDKKLSILKKLKKKLKKQKRKLKKEKKRKKKSKETNADNDSTDVPLNLMEKQKRLAPITKDEWEKQQSIVKRVYDESTGRHRLIKGDGEVIEEIVSQDRHMAINKAATVGDGNYFQGKLSSIK